MSSGTHVHTSFGRVRPREDAHGVRDEDARDRVLGTSLRPGGRVMRPEDMRGEDVCDRVLGTQRAPWHVLWTHTSRGGRGRYVRTCGDKRRGREDDSSSTTPRSDPGVGASGRRGGREAPPSDPISAPTSPDPRPGRVGGSALAPTRLSGGLKLPGGREIPSPAARSEGRAQPDASPRRRGIVGSAWPRGRIESAFCERESTAIRNRNLFYRDATKQ